MGRPLTEFQRKILGIALLISALFVGYIDSLHVPFIFDDSESVLNNGTLGHFFGFSWLNPPPDGPLGGRPFANAMFSLNMTIGGPTDFGFHLVNLLIHFATSLAVFLLLKEIFSSVSKQAIRTRALELALVSALIWSVHPLNTATVTYISQRTEELMGLCYITLVYAYWRYQKNPLSRTWCLIAIGICFFGVGCKEEMATAPVLVLLLDRTFHSVSFREALTKRRALYVGLFTSWILVGFLWFTTKNRGIGLNFGVRPYQYALAEGRIIAQYFKLIFYPKPLVFDYGLTAYRRYVEEAPYDIILAVAAATTAILVWKRKIIGFALAWFFLLLAPTSSIIPIAAQPMGENRVYLPSIAIIALAVVCIYLITRRAAWLIFTFAGCMAILGTINRNDDFRTADRIWADTITKAPKNARAYCNLGLSLVYQNRFREADALFDRAIQLQGNWSEPYTNKGKVAFALNDLNSAQHWYRLALKLSAEVNGSPGKLELTDLAGLLVRKGDLKGAAEYAYHSVALYPYWAPGWSTLGDIDFAKADYAAAISNYKRAITLSPGNASFHNNLGGALLRANQPAAAQQEFLAAVRLRSNLAKAQSNLGFMLAQSGEYALAVTHFIYALQSDPSDVETRTNLGMALLQLGKKQAAKSCFTEVLRRNPKADRVRQILATLQ